MRYPAGAGFAVSWHAVGLGMTRAVRWTTRMDVAEYWTAFLLPVALLKTCGY